MKFAFVRFFAVAVGVLCLATLPSAAQTPPSTPPAPGNPQPHGQIIFSRSTDANGETTTQAAPIAAQPAIQTAAAPSADDAERRAVTFTALDLEVHLNSAAQRIAVRALLTVRNGGKAPLARIPLQISSSLNWERVRLDGKDVSFPVATVNSDTDHTGQLHEAAIRLAQPLAPGQSLQLDVTYSGEIAASAQRLVAIGAPEDQALRSDWDQIGVPFTGLRGFGNVVWYPAASVPALLGDGARLFDEMGEQKLRLSGARFRLRLIDEFPHGQAPTVALVNGQSVPLTVTESGRLDQSQEVAGVATADSGSSILGFEAPSLFLAIRTPHPGANLIAWTLPEDNVAVEFWTAAATAVTPFLQGWLGQHPRSQLTLLDLPDPGDAPFETGALLAVPLRESNPQAGSERLDGVLVHALTHAWIALPNSPQPPPAFHPSDKDLSPGIPAWLDEGVATFMGALWVERQQGREAALRTLEADRAALALAEPASPGEGAGQPLAQAVSPIYYRTKAAYVLWMLRNLAGDPTLSAALRAYYPAASSAAGQKTAVSSKLQDATRDSGKPSARSLFERLLEAPAGSRDLGWFFADWVDADKGLPDLKIAGVFPNAVSAGNWLVAVDMVNTGYAAAEIPVSVRTGFGSSSTSVTKRVLVPARGKITERILIPGKPTEVQANDGTVPEIQASIHTTKLDDSATASPASSQSTPAQP
jgi:hypothetical protein